MPAEPEDTITSVDAEDGLDDLARSYQLIVLHSPDPALPPGSTVPLGPETSLGRPSRDPSTRVIADKEISRLHCVLVHDRASDRVTVLDRGSKNGTFVDGRRIDAAALQSNGVLRIGNTVAVLEPVPPPSAPSGSRELIGVSAAFRDMVATLNRVAGHPVSVHLHGETGTGKELAARHLHANSGRAGSFVPLNCGAVPADLAEATLFGHERGAFTGAQSAARGLFREADRGTLFLDEIGELPLALQAKLLRVLDSGEVRPVGSTRLHKVDVRIVSATHRDLRADLDDGSFRSDLFARIATYEVHLPALRNRRADIPFLLTHFLARAGRKRPSRWTAGFLQTLLLHSWPLNIRELQSIAQQLHLDAPREPWRSRDLPLSGPPSEAPVSDSGIAPRARARGRPVRPDRDELVADLEATQFTLSRLSEAYGVSRPTLYRWMKELEIPLER